MAKTPCGRWPGRGAIAPRLLLARGERFPARARSTAAPAAPNPLEDLRDVGGGPPQPRPRTIPWLPAAPGGGGRKRLDRQQVFAERLESADPTACRTGLPTCPTSRESAGQTGGRYWLFRARRCARTRVLRRTGAQKKSPASPGRTSSTRSRV